MGRELLTCPNCGRPRAVSEHLETKLAALQVGPYCCRGCAVGLECTCPIEEGEKWSSQQGPFDDSTRGEA